MTSVCRREVLQPHVKGTDLGFAKPDPMAQRRVPESFPRPLLLAVRGDLSSAL
eukprot:CAMPEP_0206471626 /NCGR_PEP_ID=MMETSP0324_2-20121206/31684_1 /ASSEMBLY_ACC=CAM_ASM_000836 /TAXON_ID=2866 /ORGANISM="Crypthecodinium cohnii, Strain Seligo" /LENGTH=52 /DNA_ID=CAMNT_0053946005 /DNA_START=1221 /DNA_END=1379 /DNA_ORIENTATION=+